MNTFQPSRRFWSIAEYIQVGLTKRTRTLLLRYLSVTVLVNRQCTNCSPLQLGSKLRHVGIIVLDIIQQSCRYLVLHTTSSSVAKQGSILSLVQYVSAGCCSVSMSCHVYTSRAVYPRCDSYTCDCHAASVNGVKRLSVVTSSDRNMPDSNLCRPTYICTTGKHCRRLLSGVPSESPRSPARTRCPRQRDRCPSLAHDANNR